MKDVLALNSKEILSIPPDQPERLFAGTIEEAKDQYRRLARFWHPDRNQAAGHRVFAHIQVLHAAAEKRILDGTWRANGLLRVVDLNGREFSLRYKKSHPFDLGHMYYGERTAAWAMDLKYEALFRRGYDTITRDLNFENEYWEKEHRRHLPKILGTVRAADRFILVVQKDPDQYLLRDVLDALGGKMEPRHAAWIISSLLNVNCYLNFTGVVHHAIALDTWFVSPENHGGALLGGWWYAARDGQKVKQVPRRTLAVAPPALARDKKAIRRTDSALIRAVGRELLGDPGGSKLITDKDVPRAMADWLLGPSEDDAYAEYHRWYHKVLQDAFGPRRFVRLAIKASDIYKEI